ncbi:MAG TPA: c-type cytochrome biogenesis protein CcmI [Xanthobacteraceae bacterium]|nr:c-type cytochrome biogenesis protein CcmI [Xanthobacteraceae bacterium]
MTLWFGVALMTAAAVWAVLWPLARRGRDLRSGSDVAVYRDQLAEIQRDRAAGLIGENEAAGAQVEISRRLIAAADAQAAAPADAASATWRRRAVAVAALILLPLGAATLYLALGSPSLPDQPLAARVAGARGNPSIDTLIAQVEDHLSGHPEDGRGWEVIAPVYLRLGRFDDAVKARRNALKLNGATAERESALGEALVFAANGVVTAEAKAAFERAIALDANGVQARYFLGLAAEQDGDRTQAAATWRALIAAAPPDAPWLDLLRSALARVERGAGGVAADGSSTDASDDQAAVQLGPDQRKAMIEGMVNRLSERLHRDGADVDGWLRLVRSYMVLGEPDKARAAVVDARRALAGDAVKLQRLDDLWKAEGQRTAR